MENLLLTEQNFSRLKEIIKKNKDQKIIFHSKDDELNRKVMEKLPISGILISLEDRKDYSKQRNSGLNEVLVKIAKKKNISIYFDFEEIVVSNEKEKILSRIKQNITLCSREKVKIKFYLKNIKENPEELKNILFSLGAPTWMVSSCIEN